MGNSSDHTTKISNSATPRTPRIIPNEEPSQKLHMAAWYMDIAISIILLQCQCVTDNIACYDTDK